MMKIFYKYLFLTVVILHTGAINNLFAQSSNDEISIVETPLAKDALFKRDSTVTYNIALKNNTGSRQDGQLSYIIKTPHGKLIAQSSMQVSLDARKATTLRVEMPGQKAGFYKVNFMLNVTDYDDTVRRVFGVDINNIVSTHPKPADFNLFWANTQKELAKIPPNYKVTEKPELSKGDYKVYLVEMKSLGGVTVHAWMTLPKDRLPNEKLPVYMVLPGYGADLSPIPGTPHFACIALNVRGLGNSRDVINPNRDDYISYNLQDKNKYIYRGVIMDCKRLLDYISSNDELDSKSIFVTGGSMGGYLSLVLAGLDQRVTMVAADNPTFSDFRWTVGIDVFPMSSIQRYARTKGLPMEKLLRTLDYFDLKNFMPAVKSKTLIAMGLLDTYAPPFTELVAFNQLPAGNNKRIYIYPNLGHEVAPSLGNVKGKWLYDNFHMFDRIMALKGHDATAAVSNDDDDHADKFDTNPIGMIAHSGAKNNIYKGNNNAFYDVDLKNNLPNQQTGTLACEIVNGEGRQLSIITRDIKIGSGDSKQIRLNMPAMSSGTYRANILLNTTDFRDTLRRSFSVESSNTGALSDEPNTIAMLLHSGAKNSVFSKKNTIYYNVDLKNNFDVQQEGMLSCEVTGKNGQFHSLTSVAVKLEPRIVSTVRINLPSQKTGVYRANFFVTVPNHADTLHTVFSVDTVGGIQSESPSSENETISLVEHPANKDATFKGNSSIYYTLDLKNNFSTYQSGSVASGIYTPDGNLLSLTSLAINLSPKASKQVKMNLPVQKPGFYKVNFMVNTPDYDDTVRRVFGFDINNIRSQHQRPADFDSFWATAKKELSQVEPHFRMVEHHELERGNDEIYLIEMQSLGNITVRGWLTLPKDRSKNEKLPVYVGLPGYGSEVKPAHNMTSVAFINLSVRGQNLSSDVIKPSREEYISYSIEDKNKYIFRGAIMDCVRLIDFVYSRPEIDNKTIFVGGGSMGGYLALVLASLDKRVNICSADNPTFADYRALANHDDFPMGSIKNYAGENSVPMETIFNNLDYFDLKNFVPNIKCKTLVGIGLLDPIAPPTNSMVMYNNITAPKKIFIYPNLAHEVDPSLGNFRERWVFDNLGIF